MDVKSMLVKLAEDQADKMKQEVMNHLSSDEMSESIATAINKKIDIPEVDLSGIDDCKDKIDALSDKISAFEARLTKVEKSSKGRF